LSRITWSASLIGVSAVLHVDVRDALVLLLQERHRRRLVADDEVADVQVGAVVARVAEHLLPLLRTGLGVAVIPHHQLVLVGEGADALLRQWAGWRCFGIDVGDLG
jgi:hypothetical protein